MIKLKEKKKLDMVYWIFTLALGVSVGGVACTIFPTIPIRIAFLIGIGCFWTSLFICYKIFKI